MLMLLALLATLQLVVNPSLLWVAGKLVRVPCVSVWRAYMAYGLLLLLSLVCLAMQVFAGAFWPAVLAIGVGELVLAVWLIRLVFRTNVFRAASCLALLLVANVAVALGIKAVAFEAFAVPTVGMQPTILAGDRVLVDKIRHRFRSPQPGEVVAFRPPHSLQTIYLQRVIGVEGDRLELHGDELLLNGEPAGRCAREVSPPPGMTPLEFPAVVPPGKLFMLGDNRDNSLDSRFWGFADVKQVVGAVTIIYASTTVSLRPGLLPLDAQDSGAIRWERIGKAVR